jgi:spore germination protein KC
MKRNIIFLIMAVCVAFASGCSFPEAYPIEKEQNILIAGIDVEGGDIVLTVLVDDVSAGGEAGKEQVTYKLFQTTGATIFEADDKLHSSMEKRPSWYHTKYVLLGEEAARSGVDRLLSFFCEDDETRLLYRIAVVKDMTAKEYLQKTNTGKDDPADYLDTLFAALNQTGKSREVHLINYAVHNQTPWVSIYMPVLQLEKNPVQSKGAKGGGGDSGSSEQEYLTVLNGFALFDGDRLAGFMDGGISRGLNILTNDIHHSGVTVRYKDGSGVGLELIKCNAMIEPSFDPLSVSINACVRADLVEYHTANPLNAEDIVYLENQQSQLVCGEIAEAIACMQQLGSDPARIMDSFYHKDPVKWQAMAGDWKTIFSKLSVSIRVNSQILNTFELSEPVSSGGS